MFCCRTTTFFFSYKGGENSFPARFEFSRFDGGNIVKVEHWARFWAFKCCLCSLGCVLVVFDGDSIVG